LMWFYDRTGFSPAPGLPMHGSMKRPTDPRLETRRTVRRGERTIEVRVITYQGGKRRR
jgi:hypothetical protein